MAVTTTTEELVPTQPTGLWSWLTTVDHKRIGILYGVSAFVFFLVGGAQALLIRLQLIGPDQQFLSADAYNQLFTMHGLTMVFAVIMPASAAFQNFLVPLQIGARDVAFPRLNALSYWLFLGGALLLTSSFVFGGGADGGWFGYAPLSTELVEVVRMDFYAIGVQLLGVASIAASANFIATILTMRAPGMSMFRMPVFCWMTLVVTFLLIFSLPVIGIGVWQMFLDRNLGTLFYEAAAQGDPLLWQHMFWIFGHPEVYVLILPAMGIVSEVLPVFSRKPLFGYAFVVFSGIAIGFLGFGVWAHHMFTSGLGPVAEASFGLVTMLIAVPTGVKIFNWIGTTWLGKLKFDTPMLFALGFILMFIIGGLSGVTHSIVPADTQQHDSYYVVAHFHYVLFGGAVFGLVAGIYYWWPKITGKLLDERIGKWHFWLMLIGFNLTFFPMHILGLNGMPRRTYRYGEGLGWELLNQLATIGAFLIALSFLVFMYNVYRTIRRGRPSGDDPWDGRTLEWMTTSPPPVYNFEEIPIVEHVDEFWYRKYAVDEENRAVPMPTVSGGELTVDTTTGGEEEPEEAHEGIHMPSPSFYPLVTGIGATLIGYGLVFLSGGAGGFIIGGIGVLVLMWGVMGWAAEPVTRGNH